MTTTPVATAVEAPPSQTVAPTADATQAESMTVTEEATQPSVTTEDSGLFPVEETLFPVNTNTTTDAMDVATLNPSAEESMDGSEEMAVPFGGDMGINETIVFDETTGTEMPNILEMDEEDVEAEVTVVEEEEETYIPTSFPTLRPSAAPVVEELSATRATDSGAASLHSTALVACSIFAALFL